jgi:hypothetical protein
MPENHAPKAASQFAARSHRGVGVTAPGTRLIGFWEVILEIDMPFDCLCIATLDKSSFPAIPDSVSGEERLGAGPLCLPRI